MNEQAPTTVAELVTTYIECNPYLKSKDSRRLLSTSQRHFSAYLGREALVSDFSDRNLAGYIRHRRALPRTEATVEREASKLMCLWRFAASRAWVVAPLIRIEKAKPGEPVAFLRSEIRALYRAAYEYETPVRGRKTGTPAVPGGVMFFALMSAIWDCGERIGAMTSINRTDFRPCYGWFGILTGGWLTITSRKGGGRAMTRKLSRSTTRAVIRLLACHDHEQIFGFVDRATLYYHLNHILRAAGLPLDRKLKFHCLRKSHASHLKARGGDSTDSLGHASEQMTRERYHDKRITRRWEAVDFLFSPLGWRDRLRGLFAK